MHLSSGTIADRRALAFEARLGPTTCDAIVSDYAGGIGVTECARRHGIGAHACASLLRRRGTEIRVPSSYGRVGMPREDFFDVIDTEEKAYVLGFITADGWITGTRVVAIELAEHDREHLERIRDLLSPGQILARHEVQRGHRRGQQWRLSIASVRLVTALRKLGVGPCKSHDVGPCRRVPVALRKHYWRGVFDGDGSIVRRAGKTPESPRDWMFELTGSYPMAEGFRSFVTKNGVETSANVLPAGNVARFGFGGLGVARAGAALLYGNANLFLARKKALADELLGQEGRFDAVAQVTRARVAALQRRGMSLRAIAEELGVSYTTLWTLRVRWGMVRRRDR